MRIELADVSVVKGGSEILSNITWTLEECQSWAVFGENGAGKSTFLSLVRGDTWPAQGKGGRRTYAKGDVRQSSPIGFREKTGLVSNELLQTYRTNEWDIPGREVILSGFWGGPFLYEPPEPEHILAMEKVAAKLDIEDLLYISILHMSQGQAKKVLIARALVHDPELLILDECCDGLDRASRKAVLETLQRVAEDGTQLLYATHRPEELVGSLPAVSHALLFKNGRITCMGERERVLETAFPGPPTESRPDFGNNEAITDDSFGGASLIHIRNATVTFDGKTALDDVSWEVRPGENWAVLGENGAGKSTLLALVTGDAHPLPGGAVCRFGISERTDIWSQRRRIGYVSASFQARHDQPQTVLDTVLSGFFSHVGMHGEASEEQVARARRLIRRAGISELEERDITTLSYGQLRRTLIARALARNPELLLLDEPCGGLDARGRAGMLSLVEQLAASGVSVVYVTHHPDELIPAIRHVLKLEKGKAVYCGPRKDFRE